MKTLNKMIATSMIAMMAGTGLVSLAQASEGAAAPSAVTQETITASEIAVSGTGRNVLTGIQYAQTALAQGKTDIAKQILAELSGMFGDQDGTVLMKVDDTFALPLDTGLAVADGFTPTDAHQAAFSKAQMLMADGNIDEVITTLTDAGVDLVAQVALLPYAPTIDGLKGAAADLEAGQVDKATSALDAIGASVHVATYATDALPAQGYAVSDVLEG